jgi:CBS domain-containing protein
MVANNAGAVAVVEGDALVGIFTERDLLVKLINSDLDPSECLVEDVMETRVHTIGPTASRSQAAEVMLESHCRHLPVVDEAGKIMGMLSLRHLYREQLHRLRGRMDSLESYMTADGPGG